jgi:DNA-3-methyladenine glycosylase II
MTGVIDTPEDLGHGIARLAELEPRFGLIHRATGDPPLRREPPGFIALIRMIVYQHVSLASAGAVWRRLEDDLGGVTPQAVAVLTPDDLRRTGLTKAKSRACLALAQDVVAGTVDLDRLAQGSDAEARAGLVALPGIGPWTAELYLLTCLGRTDAWPGGDVALRSAARDVFELDERPDTRAMELLAEPWRPWRAVAARLLWAHYSHAGVGG